MVVLSSGLLLRNRKENMGHMLLIDFSQGLLPLVGELLSLCLIDILLQLAINFLLMVASNSLESW